MSAIAARITASSATAAPAIASRIVDSSSKSLCVFTAHTPAAAPTSAATSVCLLITSSTTSARALGSPVRGDVFLVSPGIALPPWLALLQGQLFCMCPRQSWIDPSQLCLASKDAVAQPDHRPIAGRLVSGPHPKTMTYSAERDSTSIYRARAACPLGGSAHRIGDSARSGGYVCGRSANQPRFGRSAPPLIRRRVQFVLTRSTRICQCYS
jgi:hypothetical protein